MTSGYILIVAIFVLGGVIAASGDRIGTRVGKARLTLFNLRPRQTATLVTIVTGSLIAVLTLGILLAADKRLRTGVFDLKKIEKKLSTTRKDLSTTRNDLTKVVEQKNQVETELTKAKADQAEAQKQLDLINKSLKAAIAKQALTATQLKNTQLQLKTVSQQKVALSREIEQLQAERQELTRQRDQVKDQVTQLNTQVTQLNTQINQLSTQITQLKSQITQRDREINKRDQTIAERNRVIAQRQELEKRLKQEIAKRESRLTQLEQQFQKQEKQLKERQAQLQQQDKQLKELEKKLQAGEVQLEQRDKQLKELETKLQVGEIQLEQRDKQLKELEKQLQVGEVQLEQRDKQLKELETKLQERENRLNFLEQEVGSLEEGYQVLRQGNVALLRGQVLASGVLRIVDPSAARPAIDQLLSQANRTAMETTGSTSQKGNERVVQITQAQVDQLLKQINDGRDYVVRIFSAGNYVVGEKQIQVFADADLNQIVFRGGEIVAATSAEPLKMSEGEIRKQIDLLLATSQFRARRSGILGNTNIQVGDGRITTLIRFMEQIKEYNQPIDIKAVVAEDTYTAGPLKIKLIAIKDGQIIFST